MADDIQGPPEGGSSGAGREKAPTVISIGNRSGDVPTREPDYDATPDDDELGGDFCPDFDNGRCHK